MTFRRVSLPRFSCVLSSILVGAGLALSFGNQCAGCEIDVRAAARASSSKARVDQYGDPLPACALARIGTVRFRTGSSILAVRFSPDGKTLASIGHDGVFLWDALSGKKKRFWPKAFYRGSYSPDGRKLWLQTHEGAIFVWDLTAHPDPGPVAAPFAGDNTMFFELSPDGKLLAAGNKKMIRLWDISTGKLVRELEGHDNEVSGVAFCPDGKHLVSLARGDPLYWWDLESGQAVRSFRKEVKGFSPSPDGKVLALIFDAPELSIQLVNTRTGEDFRTIALSDSANRSMGFSPNGKIAALASQNDLRVCEVATSKELWHVPTHGNQFFSIAFSPDGKTLAAGSVFMLRTWDVATGKERVPIHDHPTGIGFVMLSADGKTVFAGGIGEPPESGQLLEETPCLQYWDSQTGKLLGRPRRGFPQLAAISADGKLLACWTKDHHVQVWDLAGDKEICQVPYEDEVTACRLSPDGRIMVLASRDREMNFVESDDGSIYVERVGKLEFWSAATGNLLKKWKGRVGTLWDVEFSPNGRFLATIGYPVNALQLWEVANQRELHRFSMEDRPLWRACFSPDSATLAAGGSDPTVYLWDVKSGRELGKLNDKLVQEKHDRGVFALAMSADGKTLATTDNFGKVFFWDKTTGKQRAEIQAHQFRVTRLAFSADGKLLLTKGASTAIVWDVNAILKTTPVAPPSDTKER